jgi:hypothetical protein
VTRRVPSSPSASSLRPTATGDGPDRRPEVTVGLTGSSGNCGPACRGVPRRAGGQRPQSAQPPLR